VVIEDSAHGVAAAKAAGIFTVAFPNPVTRQLSLAHADVVADCLLKFPPSELLTRVSRLKTA